MNKSYINIPMFTTINEIKNKNYNLSATQYKTFDIKNKNVKCVGEFLDRNLERKDLGVEVGSKYYIKTSEYIFIKTKALQEHSYLLDKNKESIQYITNNNFQNYNLKKEDLLISKDSNVGEIAILDKDYKNAMLCGGLYRLPITNNKYYLLAFVKNEIFKSQIDFMVPRGSTIKHGKTKFLECKIPIPNKNKENTMKYIEVITKAIIEKEIKIQELYNEILFEIERELKENQKPNLYTYKLPTINNIINLDRMDSALYSNEFKKMSLLY